MTTIKVMADYECWPLWNGDNLDPDSLPLSTYLREQLAAWAERYDETLLDDIKSSLKLAVSFGYTTSKTT
jgi:hypothetical protein